MTKSKLKVSELFGLELEIGGFKNPTTGEVISEGLKGLKLKLGIKVNLSDLLKNVSEQVKTITTERDEMIKKLGVSDEKGSVTIPKTLENGEVNTAFEEFQKEFEELLNSEKELSHEEFPYKEFSDIESEDTFDIFFSRIVTK